MTNEQAALLVANGVKLHARVTRAPMEDGFCVELRTGNSMEWEWFGTARDPAKPRVFRSLHTVWKVIVVGLQVSITIDWAR